MDDPRTLGDEEHSREIYHLLPYFGNDGVDFDLDRLAAAIPRDAAAARSTQPDSSVVRSSSSVSLDSLEAGRRDFDGADSSVLDGSNDADFVFDFSEAQALAEAAAQAQAEATAQAQAQVEAAAQAQAEAGPADTGNMKRNFSSAKLVAFPSALTFLPSEKKRSTTCPSDDQLILRSKVVPESVVSAFKARGIAGLDSSALRAFSNSSTRMRDQRNKFIKLLANERNLAKIAKHLFCAMARLHEQGESFNSKDNSDAVVNIKDKVFFDVSLNQVMLRTGDLEECLLKKIHVSCRLAPNKNNNL